VNTVLLPHVPYLENEPLSKHTSYRIGGPAKYLAFPENKAHLENLAKFLKEKGEAFAILGNGSNVLAPDDGFNGWVIKTTNLKASYARTSNDIVEFGAGTLNSRILKICSNEGLSGLEYLAGVPGTIGGAVYMNAGTASGWVSQNLLSVDSFSLVNGGKHYEKDQLKYSYREQHYLSEDEIILAAKFQMKTTSSDEIKEKVVASINKRKLAQPIELPSCGSVFRNPNGTSAWKLIEEAGLRGIKCGGARISAKHVNFIVNEGGATRNDVLHLIQLVKEKVLERTGVSLIEEVVLLKPKYLK